MPPSASQKRGAGFPAIGSREMPLMTNAPMREIRNASEFDAIRKRARRGNYRIAKRNSAQIRFKALRNSFVLNRIARRCGQDVNVRRGRVTTPLAFVAWHQSSFC